MDLWTVLRSGQRADESNTISNNREEAMESHMYVCNKFNSTMRLNPKLVLAGFLREGYSKEEEHETQGCKGLVGIHW
ncbi:unnamed protein product [Musa acuminata subsp. burmannicoides]